MTGATVAVVDLGRPGALGARRRVESWIDIFTAAGAAVEVIRLVEECRTPRSRLLPAVAAAAADPYRVPESALWQPAALRERLHALCPAVVLTMTARSFAPRCAPPSALQVLDYVDLLSANYEQRAGLARGPLNTVGLRALAWQMRRFERRPLPVGRRVAAGAGDAATLGAEWVPNVVTVPTTVRREAPTHDLLFMGSLAYEPNVAALRRLARLWPRVQAARPGTTLLVAGTSPRTEVRSLVQTLGWGLWEDFDHLPDVCARSRLSLATLEQGTGIQNKVLDAAAHGLAQVVSPGVLAGVGRNFPAAVAETDAELVAAITRLLDDPAERAFLAELSQRFVGDRFCVARWKAWAEALVDSASLPGRAGDPSQPIMMPQPSR